MSTLFYQTLLGELSTRLGIHPLAFDDQGACDLLIDDHYPLQLKHQERQRRLLLIGLLPIRGEPPLQRLLGAALNPLLDGGPGLGWDAASGLYVAYQSIPEERLTATRLTREIGALVEWARAWSDTRP